MNAARAHWPEYAMEAVGLGAFMVAAAAGAILLEHPASVARMHLADPVARRALMGLAMGLTAAAIIYSPWGKRSGAHINPAVTLAFLRLGKIRPVDAAAYVAAQCVGAVAGVALVAALSGGALADPSVRYVVTTPGPAGAVAAFAAEATISFALMLTVLVVSNDVRIARYTGAAAAVCVALFIFVEAPLSGMSMNPARTLGSAVVARDWTGFWLYVVAPLAGMLAATEAYARSRGAHRVLCAKLHHDNPHRCIFRCAYPHETESV